MDVPRPKRPVCACRRSETPSAFSGLDVAGCPSITIPCASPFEGGPAGRPPGRTISGRAARPRRHPLVRGCGDRGLGGTIGRPCSRGAGAVSGPGPAAVLQMMSPLAASTIQNSPFFCPAPTVRRVVPSGWGMAKMRVPSPVSWSGPGFGRLFGGNPGRQPPPPWAIDHARGKERRGALPLDRSDPLAG